MRNRLIGTILVIAVLVWVIWLSLGGQEYSCEVCMEFSGRTECRSASGPTREEATRTATTAACATLASGMEASIRCERTPPKSVDCRPR